MCGHSARVAPTMSVRNVASSGEKDDRQWVVRRGEAFLQLQAALSRHPQIQHQAAGLGRQSGEEFNGRRIAAHRIAGMAEQPASCDTARLIVFDNVDDGSRGH
jgi:hypothetical protein